MFKRLFNFKNDWMIMESNMAVWNLSHGGGAGVEQNFCFYEVYYSPSRDYYKLKTKGFRAEEHSMYGQMIFRTAQLNSGALPFDYIDKEIIESNDEDIVILTFPLKEKAQDVFSYQENDKELTEAMNNTRKELENKGVTVFEQKQNVIATNRGYYVALWEDSVENLEDFDDLEDID